MKKAFLIGAALTMVMAAAQVSAQSLPAADGSRIVSAQTPAGDFRKAWTKDYSGLDQNPLLTGEPGFVTDLVQIRATAGTVNIKTVDLVAADGTVLSLAELLDSAANRKAFGKGVVDKTGNPRIPSKITLRLPQPLELVAFESIVRSQTGAGAKLAVILFAPKEVVVPTPTPLSTPGPTPRPTATPRPPLPTPRPTATPLPPSPTPPPPVCDVRQLQRELYTCQHDVATKQGQIATLQNETGPLQYALAALGWVKQQKTQCESDLARLNETVRVTKESARREAAQAAQARQGIEGLRNELELIANYPQRWNCWIRSRHGEIFEATGDTSPGLVLKDLAKNNCGEGQCGKKNWNQDWGCRPVR